MPTYETKSGIDVAEFRKDYLFGMASHLRKPDAWSESYLTNKIREAEQTLEREMGCFYTPKRIICEPAAHLVQGKDYDVAEPAYDYSSDFYVGENWGSIRLRHYPVRRTPIPQVFFAYPNADKRIFTVPTEWVRLNGPFGMIRLVPSSSAIAASFSAFVLSVFSGGRGIPQSIFVNYTAGFDSVAEKQDLQNDYQDLLELTKRRAVLNIIQDSFAPNSESNSTDGISQSFSHDIAKLQDDYDKSWKRFRNRIKGVVLTVV